MNELTFVGVWMTPDVGETVCFMLGDDRGSKILVDCGTNLVRGLLNADIKPEDITDIIVTHIHGDHISGLPTYLFYRLMITRNVFKREVSPLTIHTTSTFVEKLKQYISIPYPNFIDDPLIRFNVISMDRENQIGNYRFKLFPSKHVPGTFGFSTNINGKRVIYSGDTGLSETVLEEARCADFLIHDIAATSDYAELSGGHTLASEISPMLSKYEIKKFIPVHRLPVYKNNLENYISEIVSEYDGELIVPDDGQKIIIEKD